jgi:hypothetical protein
MSTDVENLRDTIVPKSDQLNADDLIAGPITVKVTKVRRGDKEQPLAIEIEGRMPYKPCKSMRRVLILAWGDDGRVWVGRSMTLYRDDEVKFGGVKVGGIRISHLSHIDRPMELALTVTKGSRKPYKVLPLAKPTESKPADNKPADNKPADNKPDPLRAAVGEARKAGRWNDDQIAALLKHHGAEKLADLAPDKAEEVIKAVAGEPPGFDIAPASDDNGIPS